MKPEIVDPVRDAEQLDVVLLSPPYDFPPRPSIALSLFRQCLNEAGMRAQVLYPMFRLSHMLGMDACRKIDAFPYSSGLEEYLFAHMTDVENTCSDETFAAFLCREYPVYSFDEVLSLLIYAREKARLCVDELALEIARRRPGVLAVSSIFSQVNGALAVIKRVKEIAPGIASILGGTNVSGEAGAAILRHYPSVDYVFFGEGDEVFAQVCRIAMGLESGPMPYGVVRRGEPVPDPIPHRMTENMNQVCWPDYSDYVAEWEREQAGSYGVPMFGRQFVEENISNSEAGVGDMASAAAVSRSGLQRKLKQTMGITPQDLLKEARIKRACQLLRQTDKNVAEVAYACGFSDPKYFSRSFKQSTGKSPTEYRDGVE